MNRAFSSLTIRAMHEDERVIEGFASTPTKDRMGDVVESDGVEFNLPIPFLLDHDHRQAVGEVEHVEVTRSGIKFIARIKKIAEAGEAKDLCDKAWTLIKAGLRRSVSIGFLPVEMSPQKGGGYRYSRWNWVELSAVAVPAQPDARITATRSAGSKVHTVVRLNQQDMRMGKLIAAAHARAAARKRMGIANPTVKLDAAEIRKGREILASQAKPRRVAAGKRGHVVRIDPAAMPKCKR